MKFNLVSFVLWAIAFKYSAGCAYAIDSSFVRTTSERAASNTVNVFLSIHPSTMSVFPVPNKNIDLSNQSDSCLGKRFQPESTLVNSDLTNNRINQNSGNLSAPADFSPVRLINKGMQGFIREQDTGPMICTDRNSVTPHPNAVPTGYLQIETGMTLDKFHRGGDFILPETVARLGTWKDGEFRFQVPNYVRSTSLQGATDIQLSIKQDLEPHVLNKFGLDLGVITGFSAPTGSRVLTTGTLDPFVQVIGFYKFHPKYTIGTSHSIFMPTQVEDSPAFGPVKSRNLTYQPTVILFKHMGDLRSPDRIDIWAEYAGQFYENIPSNQIIDFGAVWRPYMRHQVDFRFGVGISNAAPRAFLGFGYSWLVGKVIPFYKKHPEHLYRP